jgi:HIV-1 Vpr-binding protein
MKTGQIQLYVKEPVLQEKRHEHVLFQKYALEIIRLVYGGKMIGVEYDLSVVAIHKSDLISQTRIQYNEKQLLQLVHEYLVGKGLKESAAVLAQEGKLENVPPPLPSTSHGHNPIVNGLPLTPARPGKSSFGFKAPPAAREVNLDTIVREYLTNQHSLCKAPMATCPTFDLLVPHKCPTPKTRPTTVNFSARFGRTGYNWCGNTAPNRKLIYSKFKPIR